MRLLHVFVQFQAFLRCLTQTTCAVCHSMKFVCSSIQHLFTIHYGEDQPKHSIFKELPSVPFTPEKIQCFDKQLLTTASTLIPFDTSVKPRGSNSCPFSTQLTFRKPARIKPHGEDYVISQRNSLLTEAMIRRNPCRKPCAADVNEARRGNLCVI